MDSVEYEQQLVGAMMIKGDHIDCQDIIGKLPEEAFENFHTREMYKAISSLLRKCEPVDMISVKDSVHESTKDFVIYITRNVVSGANIKAWAKKVRQCWMIREAVKKYQEAINVLSNANPSNLNESVLAASTLTNSVQFETNDKLPRRLSEILPDWLDVIEKRMQGQESGLYLKVGIDPIDEKYGGFDRTDLIVIAGSPGMGKEMSNETPILLSNGNWTTHGEVEIGDKLASVDGLPSTVTGVFPQGSKDIYLVTLEDGRVVEAGADHLWDIESSRFKGTRTVTTLEMMSLNEKTKMNRRLRLPLFSGNFGADNDSDAWLIGVLIGDGGLTSSVRFSNTEEYILERVKMSLKGLSIRQHGIDYDISGAGNNWLLKKLRNIGLMGKKSIDKFIPDYLFKCDRDTRGNLLAGILETDGWIEKNNCMMYASSSEKLRDDVARLVRSLGGVCRKSRKENVFYVKDGERHYCNDSFKLSIRLPDEIKEFIKSPRLLKNMKPSRFKVQGVAINSVIKADYKKDCTCIMVDHDRHLYLAGDYVVTHNTELAIKMANAIGENREKGLFVSMEMSEIQIADRHVADKSGLSMGVLRNPGNMTDEDYARMGIAVNQLMEQDNYVIDETMTVDAIIAHAERMVMGDGLGFLCVDYLGLVKKNKAERNDLAIGDITRRLKEFALKYKVPVILLSQLNRKVAERADKRPIIQDLKESSSIESDADVVIFPYRDEVHNKESSMKGIAEIIVAKYRSGEPMTAYMGWKNGHFINIDQEDAAMRFAENERDSSPKGRGGWRD